MALYFIGDLIVFVVGFCFGQLVSKEIVDSFRDQTENFYAANNVGDRIVSIVFSLSYVLFSVFVAIFGYVFTPWSLRVFFPAGIQPQHSSAMYTIAAVLSIPLYLYLNRKALLTTKSLT